MAGLQEANGGVLRSEVGEIDRQGWVLMAIAKNLKFILSLVGSHRSVLSRGNGMI